jgi:heat shock transcription factor, other eukaryote
LNNHDAYNCTIHFLVVITLFASYIQGFRKVHGDRWEFAHEDFLQGGKHLLKRIVRRRPSPRPKSRIQPASSSAESSLDPELHTLRREKTALVQEVARLKQEHRQTIERMSILNQRLESAEDRQKQTMSLLVKLLQTPTVVRQLKLHKEQKQKEIDSTRVKRKFRKHVPHGSIESGEASSVHTGESGSHFLSSSPMAVQDNIAGLQKFLLEDDDFNFSMNPENIGLESVEASEDIGALVQWFITQDELGSGAEMLEMPPTSGPLGQNPTIGRYKGKNVPCPGLDETPSEADCLRSLSENMGGMDTSAALQSFCSGSSQQAYCSLASDPCLTEIANNPEIFWDLDF